MGADDYMTKPFGIEELLARILATLRRTRPAAEATLGTAPTSITVGDLCIDLAGELVRIAGAEVHLTPTEFALLRELALNRGKLLSRTHLLRQVWGRAYETETEYVRVYISRLRAKLEPPGSRPLIITRQGAGVPNSGVTDLAGRGWLPGFRRLRTVMPGTPAQSRVTIWLLTDLTIHTIQA